MVVKSGTLTLNAVRPKQVFQYSFKECWKSLKYDNSGLSPPMKLPSWIQPGSNFDRKQIGKWNVKKGAYKFTPFEIPPHESTIKNLLLTWVEYQSTRQRENPPQSQKSLSPVPPMLNANSNPSILCPNGFFNDVVLKSDDIYEVIYYKNQLIFANTSRRTNQNQILSYIGLKFENYLKEDKSMPNNDHYKALLNGKYGDWSFHSAVEVDGVTTEYSENLTDEERMQYYIEAKLCYIKRPVHPREIKSLKNNLAILKFLNNNVNFFHRKLLKYIQQSYFGRQDQIVIGVRDSNFNIITAFQMPVADLIKFLENQYPQLYCQFQNGVEEINRCLYEIYNFVQRNLREEEKQNVFLVKLSNKLEMKTVEEVQAIKIFDTTLIQEFVNMNRTKI